MTLSDRPRIGLVGAGGISASHLPHLLRLGSEVAVFADDGAPELTERFGGRVVDSFAALLDACDVVDVVTPTPTHADLVAAALQAGKDVICEKPLTRHAADAEALVALADAEGRQLHVAHVVRYFPEYVRLHDAVVAGLLGEVAVQRFTRSGAYPIRTAWFGDRAASGGIVLDQMIHDLDVARWTAGEVVSVSAARAGGGRAAEPVETAHVLLTHESGAISQVSGVWGAQHLQFTTSYAVAGTLGTLQHDSRQEQPLQADLTTDAGAGASTPAVDPAEDPYFLELEEFVGAIRGGPAPRVSAADAVAAIRIGIAALRSIDTGAPVAIPASRKDHA